MYFTNIDPPNTGDQTYENYYEANKNRRRVIYTGTNDGIMHMFYSDANGNSDAEAGLEAWGFIPDAVLPSLYNIVMNGEHTYTVDGRITAEDVYWEQGGVNKWTTLMVFGLRRGGNAYYGMDITQVTNNPKVLWKFEDSTYSGQSWGKPLIGKIRIYDPNDPSKLIDKWVVFLTGGMAYNREVSTDKKGKAIFIVDASNGQLLYMVGYDPTNGETDDTTTKEVDLISNDNIRYLTKSAAFNHPVPSAMTVIDSKSKGRADAIFFGNTGGQMFKLDMSLPNMADWKVYHIYKTEITTKATGEINGITGDADDEPEFTLQNNVIKNFTAGDPIIGETSKAIGYITGIDGTAMDVKVYSGTFQDGENIITRVYDPIYLSPGVSFGQCSQLWVMFGTGDRDRPRTNSSIGGFVALLDDDSIENMKNTDLTEFTWGTDGDGNPILDETITSTNTTSGWFFNFPDSGEKIFDPEPIVLPDSDGNPHVFFNTYQPPTISIKNLDNPCDSPDEGSMKLYDIMYTCSHTFDTDGNASQETKVGGTAGTGRVAGGGGYGSDFIIFESESGDVASAPGNQSSSGGEPSTGFDGIKPKLYKSASQGGIIFWKVKKR
jgi:Tfp pilus tip-associated adhesin PilY1